MTSRDPEGVPLGAHMPPEVAHIEVAQYPAWSGLLTGSDVSHVTLKGVPLGAHMHNQKLGFPALFSGVFGYDV